MVFQRRIQLEVLYLGWMDCKWKELVATCWSTKGCLSFNENIRNLTSGDLGNSTCGNLTGSSRIEKENVMYLLDLFDRRGEKGQCDLVCGALLDDWAVLVYVDVLFTFSECSFNSLGKWSYSREWVWNVGTKSMLHCFTEMKCQVSDTSGI